MFFNNPITEITQRHLYPVIKADLGSFFSRFFAGGPSFISDVYNKIADYFGIEHDEFSPEDFRTEVWMSPSGKMCAIIGFPEAKEEYDCSACALAVGRDSTIYGLYLMEMGDSDAFLMINAASEASEILAVVQEADQNKHFEIMKSHIS